MDQIINETTMKCLIKSFIVLAVYAEACNEFAGPISTSLRLGNTAAFEEMLQRWRAVSNNVFDLTHLRFKPQS